MNDNDFIEAEYIGPGGNRHVQGSYQFDVDPGVSSKRVNNKWVIYYGYISGGRGVKRLVYKEDLRLNPNLWREVPKTVIPPKAKPLPIEPPVPLKPPAVLEKVVFDIETLPGITPKIAEGLRKAGLDSKEKILEAGVDKLTEVKGIAENRARVIIRALSD